MSGSTSICCPEALELPIDLADGHSGVLNALGPLSIHVLERSGGEQVTESMAREAPAELAPATAGGPGGARKDRDHRS